MNTFRFHMRLVLVACGLALLPGLAGAAETPAATPGTAVKTVNATPGASIPGASITAAQKNAARAIFAGQCSWCHGDYGMTADRGPKLAGTAMTRHQVEQRIRNGKPGYMPSFKRFLNDQQIALMAKYIKSLKP